MQVQQGTDKQRVVPGRQSGHAEMSNSFDWTWSVVVLDVIISVILVFLRLACCSL